MDWLEVLTRIETGEDVETEFKRGAGDMTGVGKAVCAFANGSGGLLVMGVEDSGEIVGVREDGTRLEERLTSFLQTGCGRPVSATLGHHEHQGARVHWVDVDGHQRGAVPFQYGGRYWLRRGRSSVAPSPSELQELFNAFGLVMTEKQVIVSGSVEDIDLLEFRRFMTAQGMDMESVVQPGVEDDLRNAVVLREDGGVLRPTLYGLMVFGKEPQSHPVTGDLHVECAAYEGDDRSGDVVNVATIRGRLDEQVSRSVGWLESLGRQEKYRGLFRRDLPLLPRPVLREALLNAVIHRDYAITGSRVTLEVFSRRIDVTSPGALPNHMTVEQARGGGAPRSRNEFMANAMVVRGLMERRGRGWPLMRKYMRDFNGTEPELVSEEGQFTRVTFRLEGE